MWVQATFLCLNRRVVKERFNTSFFNNYITILLYKKQAFTEACIWVLEKNLFLPAAPKISK